MTIVAGVYTLLETILERDKRQKKRRYVSQCAVPKIEVVCKQEIINEESSTLQHGVPLMYITSNSNRTPPLTIYSIGRLHNANRKRDRRETERMHQTVKHRAAEIQTVNQFNQEHTTKKKTKTKINVK